MDRLMRHAADALLGQDGIDFFQGDSLAQLLDFFKVSYRLFFRRGFGRLIREEDGKNRPGANL